MLSKLSMLRRKVYISYSLYYESKELCAQLQLVFLYHIATSTV